MSIRKLTLASLVVSVAGITCAATLSVTNGLAYWMDASQISGVTNGVVISTWPDASGNGNDMVVVGGQAAPTFAEDAIGGKPAVRFTNLARIDSTVNVANPYTLIVVARMHGARNGRLISSQNVNYLLGYHGGGWDGFYADGWNRDNQYPLSTDPHIFMASGDGTNPSFYSRDGVLELYNGAGRSPVGILTLGASGVYGENSDGDIAEAIVFSRVITEAERNALGVYLGKKYGIDVGFIEFKLQNDETGSDKYFSAPRASLAVLPLRPDAIAYQLSLSSADEDLDRDGWVPFDPATPPTSASFPQPATNGEINVYLWLKDGAGNVESFAYPITYTDVAPTPVAEDFETGCLGDEGGYKRVYVTDIDKGSIPNVGTMFSTSISCPDDSTPDADYITLARSETPYAVTLTVKNEAGVVGATNVFVTVGHGFEAFDISFETPAADGDYTPITTIEFSANGGMDAPTDVTRNGYGGRGAGLAASNTRGFSSQYARMFAHNTDSSVMQLLPTSATPFIGTDSNPGNGRLWVYSMDLAVENAPTVSPIDSVLDFTYPSVFLMTPGDNLPIFQITFAERSFFITHADGASVIVPNASANTPYRIVVEMNVDEGTFRVRAGATANGEPAYVPGIFRLQQDVSEKGIGGFYIHSSMAATWAWYQTQLCSDNIRLAGDVVGNSVDGFLVTDAATGDPTTATGSSLSIAGTTFGPGYTHYILEAATSSTPPADSSDSRWVAGEFPNSLSLASPVDGTVYDVNLWLLDDSGHINGFTQQIVYSASAVAATDASVSFDDNGRPVLSWNTASATGGRVLYGATDAVADGATDFSESLETTHSVTLDGLVPGGMRYYRIENGSATAATGSFDYRSATPAISDVVIATNHVGHVAVSWTTDAPAIGWIEVSAGDRAVRSEFGALGTSHTADVGGFAPNKRATVRIHADASLVTASTRTRDTGAFTLTFDDDPYITALYSATDGFGLVRTEPYDVEGGMTRPTYAYRASSWGRDDTVVVAPNARFPTTHLRLRAHNGNEGGLMQLMPPDDKSITAPIANTDKNYAGKPWTFSFDACTMYDILGTESRNVYAALFTNYGENGTAEPILVVRLYNYGFLVEYLDGEGVQQDCVLVSGLERGGDGFSVLSHFEFTLDMESDTFTATVNGTQVGGTMGFLCGPTDKGIGGIVFAAQNPGVNREDKVLYDDICLLGGHLPAGSLFMLK